MLKVAKHFLLSQGLQLCVMEQAGSTNNGSKKTGAMSEKYDCTGGTGELFPGNTGNARGGLTLRCPM